MNAEQFIKNQRCTGVTVQKCIDEKGAITVTVCDWQNLRVIALRFDDHATAEAFLDAAHGASNCGRQSDWVHRDYKGDAE